MKSSQHLRIFQNSTKRKQLSLKNGFTIFKIENQELKNLNAQQVEDLLHGSIGSTFQLQLNEKSLRFTQ